jgi:hypothetical protein
MVHNTWADQVPLAVLEFPTLPDCPHHPDHRIWAWEVPRCTTIMTIQEDLKEEGMMLAVCFTRCDAIKRNCWMLNDTSVVSAHACTLHTLLDVIPLDTTAHACLHICYTPIAPFAHVWFGSTQGGLVPYTFSNMHANFLSLQDLSTVNHTHIITRRQTGSLPLPTYAQHKTSILRTRRATRWQTQVVCLLFTMVSAILRLRLMRQASPSQSSKTKTKRSESLPCLATYRNPSAVSSSW